MTGRRVACRLLLLLLLPEDHGARRAMPSQGAGKTMGGGERGLQGERRLPSASSTTERDCIAGRGISKESYSAGCQAVCSASAY